MYSIIFASLHILVYFHYTLAMDVFAFSVRLQVSVVMRRVLRLNGQISCAISLEHVKLISIKDQMNLFAQWLPLYVRMSRAFVSRSQYSRFLLEMKRNFVHDKLTPRTTFNRMVAICTLQSCVQLILSRSAHSVSTLMMF